MREVDIVFTLIGHSTVRSHEMSGCEIALALLAFKAKKKWSVAGLDSTLMMQSSKLIKSFV